MSAAATDYPGPGAAARLLIANRMEMAELDRVFHCGAARTSFPACREMLDIEARELAGLIIASSFYTYGR